LDILSKDAINGIMEFMRLHAAWGAPILFTVMLLEGIILTTFIFSGSLMIVAAGALVQAGLLPYPAAFLAIVFGYWLGDWINYEIGRRGEHWFRNLSIVRNRPGILEKAENLIARHGSAAIFISRFMGPTRPFVTFLAGACHMNSRAFHGATLLSTMLLAAGLLNAGMTGVQLWERFR